VRESAGFIDLYRPTEYTLQSLNIPAMWSWLHRATGVEYPKEVLIHDWVVIASDGRFARHYKNSDDPEFRRVCSMLAHAAFRIHGMPPMVERDCEAYPETFRNPQWFSYLATLDL